MQSRATQQPCCLQTPAHVDASPLPQVLFKWALPNMQQGACSPVAGVCVWMLADRQYRDQYDDGEIGGSSRLLDCLGVGGEARPLVLLSVDHEHTSPQTPTQVSKSAWMISRATMASGSSSSLHRRWAS